MDEKWLERVLGLYNNNPNISDGEALKLLPELKGDTAMLEKAKLYAIGKATGVPDAKIRAKLPELFNLVPSATPAKPTVKADPNFVPPSLNPIQRNAPVQQMQQAKMRSDKALSGQPFPMRTVADVHAEELGAAEKRMADRVAGSDLVVKDLLSEKKKQAYMEKMQADIKTRGVDATANPVIMQRIQQIDPKLYAPDLKVSDREALEFKHDENNTREILHHYAKLHPDKGGEVAADAYLLDSQARGKNAEKILKNTEGLRAGVLTYNIKNGGAVQRPENFFESVASGVVERNRQMNAYDRYTGDKDAVITELEAKRDTQDYDTPIPTAVGGTGQLANMLGMEGVAIGKGGAIGGATNLIPGLQSAAPWLIAAVNGQEYYKRGYVAALEHSYNQLRDEGMAAPEAFDKARSQAQQEAVIGAAEGAGLGFLGAKAGAKITPFSSGGQKVLGKLMAGAKGFIKENAIEGGKIAGASGALQVGRNALAEQKGIHRDLSEGLAEHMMGMMAFHFAMAGVTKLGKMALNPKEYATLLQNVSRQPDAVVDGALADLVTGGRITVEDAEAAKGDIEAHRQRDAKIPAEITDNDARVKLHDLLEQRNDIQKQIATTDEAFHEPLKEALKIIDEKIHTEGAKKPAETDAKLTPDVIAQVQQAIQTELNPMMRGVMGAEGTHIETMLKEAAQQLNASPSEAKTAANFYGPTISEIALKLFPHETVQNSTIPAPVAAPESAPAAPAAPVNVPPPSRIRDYKTDGDLAGTPPENIMHFNQGNNYERVTFIVDPAIKEKYSREFGSLGGKKHFFDTHNLKLLAKQLRDKNVNKIVDLRGIDLNKPMDVILSKLNDHPDPGVVVTRIRPKTQAPPPMEKPTVVEQPVSKGPAIIMPKPRDAPKELPTVTVNEDLTSTQNAVTSEIRERMGLDPHEPVTPRSQAEVAAEVGQKPAEAESLVAELNDKPRALTDKEDITLQHHIRDLKNQYNEVAKRLAAGEDNPQIEADTNTIADLAEKMFKATMASKLGGTETARGLSARQRIIKEDYSPAGIYNRFRNAMGGEKPPAAVEQLVKEHSDAMQEAMGKLEAFEKRIETLEAEKALRKAKEAAKVRKKESIQAERAELLQKMRDVLKDQRSKLSANPLPVEMIPVMAKLVKNLVEDGFHRLGTLVNKIHKELDGEVSKEDIRAAIVDSKEIYEQHENLKIQVEKIRRKIEEDAAKLEAARRSPSQKALDVVGSALNIPRALMASMDFSAPLRQGLVMTASEPVSALKAAGEMFKSAWSQEHFDNWLAKLNIADDKPLMDEAGLYISDPANLHLSAKEENFMTNLPEKIPIAGRLVKGSERAYVGYLNALRVNVFRKGVASFEDAGMTMESHPEVYKAWGDFVNNATGRGKLPDMLERVSPILNATFFSPRLMASRVNLLNPVKYAKMPGPVRMKALVAMGKTVGLGMAVLAMAKAAGAEVSNDPNSPDFGKIRMGSKRWDIWGGFQQYVRFFMQASSAIGKRATGQPVKRDKDALSLSGNFLRKKLSPLPAFIADWQLGKTVTGQKFEPAQQARNLITPLLMNDMYNAYKSGGLEGALSTGIPSSFGVGVMDYKDKK